MSIHAPTVRSPLRDRLHPQPMAAAPPPPSRARVPSISNLLLPSTELAQDKADPLLSLSAVAAAAERAPHRAKSQPALPALRAANPKGGVGRKNSRGSLRNAVRGAALSAAVAAQVKREETAKVMSAAGSATGSVTASEGSQHNADGRSQGTPHKSGHSSAAGCGSSATGKAGVYASAAASMRRAAVARMETEPVSDESRRYAPMTDEAPGSSPVSHGRYAGGRNGDGDQNASPMQVLMHQPQQQRQAQPRPHTQSHHHQQFPFGYSDGQPRTPQSQIQRSASVQGRQASHVPMMRPAFSNYVQGSVGAGVGVGGIAGNTSASAAQLGRTKTTPDAKRAQNRESAKRFRVAQKKRWVELQETVTEKDNEIAKLKEMLQEVTESRLPTQRHSATGEAVAAQAEILNGGQLDALALGELDLLVKLVSAPAGDRTRPSPASNVGHLHRIMVSTPDGTVTGVRHQQPHAGGAMAAGGKVGMPLWEGVPDGDQLQLRFTVLHATRMASEMAAEPVVFAYRRQIEAPGATGAPPGARPALVRIKACVHPLMDDSGSVTSLLLAEFIEA